MQKFHEVYRQQRSYVWKLVQKLGARRSELEDLTHDTFLAVFRHWKRYDPRRPIRPWLCGFTYRTVRDHHRKHATHREVLGVASEASVVSDEQDALTQLVRREGLSLAQTLIGAMPDSRRTLFVMAELEGLPVAQIAEEFRIPLNTAYSRLRLARQDFRRAVERLRQESQGL